MAKYRYTDKGLLDPTCLTPEMFYAMQSDTWAQGAAYEQERIIKLLEGDAGQQIMCLDCSKELITLIKGEK